MEQHGETNKISSGEGDMKKSMKEAVDGKEVTVNYVRISASLKDSPYSKTAVMVPVKDSDRILKALSNAEQKVHNKWTVDHEGIKGMEHLFTLSPGAHQVNLQPLPERLPRTEFGILQLLIEPNAPKKFLCVFVQDDGYDYEDSNSVMGKIAFTCGNNDLLEEMNKTLREMKYHRDLRGRDRTHYYVGYCKINECCPSDESFLRQEYRIFHLTERILKKARKASWRGEHSIYEYLKGISGY